MTKETKFNQTKRKNHEKNEIRTRHASLNCFFNNKVMKSNSKSNSELISSYLNLRIYKKGRILKHFFLLTKYKNTGTQEIF